MRLGETLIALGLVDPAGLARAIDEQPLTGKRIGSLLIARGLADPDGVSRALGEQHQTAAVLARHLAGRDPALAKLVPPEYARANMLIPIGRARGGELIVCTRDPLPALLPMLEAMVGCIVMLAVAPADAIEAVVAAVYGSSANDDFDVDVETGPVVRVEDLDGLDRLTSGAFTLVGLDDARVTKDPTQSGAITMPGGRATTPSTPPRLRSSTTPATSFAALSPFEHPTPTPLPPAPRPAPAFAPSPSPSPAPLVRPSEPAIITSSLSTVDDLDGGWALDHEPIPLPTLDQRLGELERASSRDSATDAVMAYVATRWTTALLFTVKEGAALGHRGHGVQLSQDSVGAAVFPLTAPSHLKVAYDSRAIATELPVGAGAIQDRLFRLLGQPAAPAVAPLSVGARVVGLLAVGDAVIAPAEALADLRRLSEALGAAYARILRDSKRERLD